MAHFQAVRSGLAISQSIADMLERADPTQYNGANRVQTIRETNDILQDRSELSLDMLYSLLAQTCGGEAGQVEKIRRDVEAFCVQKSNRARRYTLTGAQEYHYEMWDFDPKRPLKIISQPLFDHAAEHGFPPDFFTESYEDGMNIFDLLGRFTVLVERPFAIGWTAHTPKFMLIGLFLYGGAAALYLSTKENRRPGEEHGSARWGSPRQLCAKYRDKDPITSADVREVLDALPDGLDPARREAVQTALQLVGKVNYFWGGKSRAIGWDSRWGQLTKVWAAGSSSTGTYRPFGLDCSGFVDWIFNNSQGYIIGHGGGVIMQHRYCTNISQTEAQPGDLAFYPDDSHIGIIVGRNEAGKLLVCHCASGQNNVVVTEFGASGFTVVGRRLKRSPVTSWRGMR